MNTKNLQTALMLFSLPNLTFASEADLKIPEAIKSQHILYIGFIITLLGLVFGWYQFTRVKKLPAHSSMLDVADVIYRTCTAYLKQQGKFLAVLFAFTATAEAGYFGFLAKGHDGLPLFGFGGVALIITWSIIGILGSYSVAAF
jgi:K(+)-stimulated pyrophosphate-energized sodium pump